MGTPAPGLISAQLQLARRELLDLGLRNTLLNHRVTKSRGVAVAGARSEDVFQRLVRDGAALPFAAAGAEPAPGHLPTPYETALLQSRLLATYYAARTHIEERGVNILYFALGMLRWYEDDSGDKELSAPLVLVPVKLERTSAREGFRAAYDDEEIEGNLSLAARLAEQGVRLPELPDDEAIPLGDHYAAVAAAVAAKDRWRVEPDEIVLGFFSFSKFLMYKDLDPDAWCSAENPDGTPLLAALLRDGLRGNAAIVSEDQYLDQRIAPDVLRQVVDADSSQALAMLDVKAGANMVIQGPPGTGKSQTITNLIADAIGSGRRVLFVAEKSAALEVVKRRLDKAGLGDACLELHSHSANKKAVLRELERTLALGRPQERGGWSLEHYKRVRDELNAYCLAVNTPLDGTDWTPQQLMGELSAVRARQGEVRFPVAAVEASAVAWPKGTFHQRRGLVRRLAHLLAQLGTPAEHPLVGSRLLNVLPSEREAIVVALSEGTQSTAEAIAALYHLGALLGIAHRCDRADADVLMRAAARALTAPHLNGVDVKAAEWAARRDEIGEALSAGARHTALRGRFEPVLIDDAWGQDLVAAREVLSTVGRAWWRWFSGDYRAARRKVAGLCRGDHARDAASQLELVDAVLDAARLRRRLDELEALASRLFGVQWQGIRSDWDVLQRIFEWIVQLYRDVGSGECPRGLVEFLDGDPALDVIRPQLGALTRAIEVYDRSIRVLCERLDLDPLHAAALRRQDLPAQQARLGTMVARLGELPRITNLNNLRLAFTADQLGWVFEAAQEWADAALHVEDFFVRTALEALLRRAYEQRPALRGADGATLASARTAFQELDHASLSATRLELASVHYEGMPGKTGAGQVGILTREFQKRSRHLPIRALISSAGNAVQAIKPVFMMSPMSIAAFVPARTLRFDLVIFDEASQVKPVDALGAVMRGDQLVVVGDSKQLPPTSFFDLLTAGEDTAADEETSPTADIESVLGLACSRGAHERMLRWHYRSRHHSLITISNQQFYDNRLVVFPSPEPSGRDLGLVLHHLPHTTYDRGRSRTNPQEAEAVAKAVVEHARNDPSLSLGVAAFSLAQAEAILAQVERLRRQDPSTEAFFAAHPYEPFFVKNLESVQGDERDVILISVGYGRDAGQYLAMNFGALNGAGGERRLNVLITRARRKCEVYTNFTDDDVDLARTSAQGVVALKAFLKYARTGIADVPDQGTGEVDSPFEEEVARALRAHGHAVVHQVGSAGFRIDLGIRHADQPGRYLLGIECDGATYHRSRSARDRDRLRQQVLEGLGWSIHRIWSTDWFADPQRELARALAAIEQARIRRPEPVAAAVPAAPARLESPGTAAPILRSTDAGGGAEVAAQGVPYRLATLAIRLNGTKLHEVPPGRIAGWVETVAAVQTPVHFDDIARQIVTAAGVQRVGSRIREAIHAGVSHAERIGSVRRAGDFVWHASAGPVTVRDRSLLDASARKIERVAPEEIHAAIETVVRESHGISMTALPVAVARMFGLQRTTEDTARAIGECARAMCGRGLLRLENDELSVPRRS